MTRKSHLRLVQPNEPNESEFDPTQEELARDRPRPLGVKLSKCFKCGLRPRLEILDSSSLRAVLGELEQALKSSRGLSRNQTEKLFLAYLNLMRAQRSFYCARCVSSSVSFATEMLEALRR